MVKINEFDGVEMDYSTGATLTLSYNGKRISGFQETNFGVPMARALFHLDLLSPEVETALKLSVSAHQKLEWTLEFENALKP